MPQAVVEDAGPAPLQVTVEETANPDARKLQANRRVIGRRVLSFDTAWDAAGNALGEAIFAVDGVDGLYAGVDFVTVRKVESADWDILAPALVAALTAFLAK